MDIKYIIVTTSIGIGIWILRETIKGSFSLLIDTMKEVLQEIKNLQINAESTNTIVSQHSDEISELKKDVRSIKEQQDRCSHCNK